MLVHEANSRLKNPIAAADYDLIDSVYNVLPFYKDEFYKLIDCLGVDKWMEFNLYFTALDRAFMDKVKQRYSDNKVKLRLLEDELLERREEIMKLQEELAAYERWLDSEL